MAKRIFDTNRLINHWHRFAGEKTVAALEEHADKLIEMYGTNLIASPVLIEFLVGARSANELALYRAFLSRFALIDNGKIPRADWEEAKRLAQRVDEKRPRQLGDCLIKAIAKRLNADVITSDRGFRSRVPP